MDLLGDANGDTDDGNDNPTVYFLAKDDWRDTWVRRLVRVDRTDDVAVEAILGS